MKLAQAELKDFLDEKYELYNRPQFIESDPISVPHKFTKKEDIEIAALFSATLAWGQRPTIIRNGLRILEFMDNEPYEFILHHTEKDLKRFKGFAHRTFNAVDVAYFIKSMHNLYTNHGRLEWAFTPNKGQDMHSGLIHFRKHFLGKHPPGRTAKHIADVEKNASAKRLNMLIRIIKVVVLFPIYLTLRTWLKTYQMERLRISLKDWSIGIITPILLKVTR